MSSFFTDTILERGKKYFEQNRVFSVNQKGDQTYTGIVLGSEAYHTKIIVDDTNQVMQYVIAPMLKMVIIVNMRQHFILRLKKDFLRMNNNISILMLY